MKEYLSVLFILFMTVSSAYNLYRATINLQYIKFYISTGQEDNTRFKQRKKGFFINIIFTIFFFACLLAELLTRYA